MTDPPILTAEDISTANYIVGRLAGHPDLDDVPTHPFERWLWAAHGLVDWRTHR